MTTRKLNYESRLNKQIAALFHESEMNYFKVKFKSPLTYNDFLSNKMLMISAIRKGIPYSLFDLIKEWAPFTENDWIEFLDISSKSMQRYKAASAHLFKPVHSEKIIEMAEVTKTGLEVFGNMEKLRLWLNTPNYALGKLKPLELLKDSYGKELVISELIRIQHGILV